MTTEIRTCREAWQNLTDISAKHSVRNVVQLIDMQDFLIETELFPADVLDAYSAYNLGNDINPEQERHFSKLRGGDQGDYREGMRKKVANVVDCLSDFPYSKRAVITMSNQSQPEHDNDSDAKCLREIYLHIDDQGRLSGTAVFRAQAALIFPKNIHFIGSLMREVAERLPAQPNLGTLFYLAVVQVADRE